MPLIRENIYHASRHCLAVPVPSVYAVAAFAAFASENKRVCVYASTAYDSNDQPPKISNRREGTRRKSEAFLVEIRLLFLLCRRGEPVVRGGNDAVSYGTDRPVRRGTI